jgi:hypothetical protein
VFPAHPNPDGTFGPSRHSHLSDRTRADIHDGPEHKSSTSRPDTLVQDRRIRSNNPLATRGRTIHSCHLQTKVIDDGPRLTQAVTLTPDCPIC